MTARDLLVRATRFCRLYMRLVARVAPAAWTWLRTPRYRYLLHDDKVYRVPANITPDLVMMYLEGVNAYLLAQRAQCSRAPASVRESLEGLVTVDQMMDRLGFRPTFTVERVGIEV